MLSFVRGGQRLRLWNYGDLNDVPDGVEKADANKIIPKSDVFENPSKPGSYALFANLFRYRLLQQEHTIWVDSDLIFLSDLDFDAEYTFGLQNLLTINNAVLGAPSDSKLLKELEQQAEQRISEGLSRLGEAGPYLLTELVSNLGLWNRAKPIKSFYPIHFREIWKVFDPSYTNEIEKRISQSSGLHLWNEFLKDGRGLVKKQRPPHGSLMWKLFDEHGLLEDFPQTELDLDWVRNDWRRSLNPPSAQAKSLLLGGLGTVYAIAPPGAKKGIQALRRRAGF